MGRTERRRAVREREGTRAGSLRTSIFLPCRHHVERQEIFVARHLVPLPLRRAPPQTLKFLALGLARGLGELRDHGSSSALLEAHRCGVIEKTHRHRHARSRSALSHSYCWRWSVSKASPAARTLKLAQIDSRGIGHRVNQDVHHIDQYAAVRRSPRKHGAREDT